MATQIERHTSWQWGVELLTYGRCVATLSQCFVCLFVFLRGVCLQKSYTPELSFLPSAWIQLRTIDSSNVWDRWKVYHPKWSVKQQSERDGREEAADHWPLSFSRCAQRNERRENRLPQNCTCPVAPDLFVGTQGTYFESEDNFQANKLLHLQPEKSRDAFLSEYTRKQEEPSERWKPAKVWTKSQIWFLCLF